jgi:hypothetical protein
MIPKNKKRNPRRSCVLASVRAMSKSPTACGMISIVNSTSPYSSRSAALLKKSAEKFVVVSEGYGQSRARIARKKVAAASRLLSRRLSNRG